MAHSLLAVLSVLLAGGTSLAIGGMLAWHTYLVLTAQGTVEFYSNKMRAWESRKRGAAWANVYHLGWARNWQERFDVRGPGWWLLWALPRLQPHSGNGYVHPVVREHEDVLLANAL